MKGLFREKMEYLNAKFRTKEGLFEYLFGSLIWGFIVVEYNEVIYSTIFNFLNFLPFFFQKWAGYMIFGIVLLPLGIIITYVLTKIFRAFFKNGRVF